MSDNFDSFKVTGGIKRPLDVLLYHKCSYFKVMSYNNRSHAATVCLGGEQQEIIYIMKKLPDLFLTFAQIGVTTFGGGLAMLPILQRELVDKRHWTTEEELADYYAIGQCTPGVIAVNTATFVGYAQAGIPGGIVATLGLVFPSFVIITLLAAFLSNFADMEAVKHAFNGIRACVVALILISVIKLGKKSIIDNKCVIIFLAVLGLSLFTPVSPAILVIIAALTGLILRPDLKSKDKSDPSGQKEDK